ncbi:MAG: glycoside hydrolase family 127 protein, partial [Candidatus Cryptobacteroides sp.]
GSHKVYSTPENSFWCCVGSGFESHAKYAESIYFHNADSLYVNLLIPSVLQWRQKGMTITQQTEFPEAEVSRLSVSCEKPVVATFMIRCPQWCSNPSVKVNGKKVKCRQGEYVAVERKWKEGDVVEICWPMSLRLEKMASDNTEAAIFYGPVLMAARLGTEGFTGCQPDSDPTMYNDYYKYDYHIPEGINDTLSEEQFNGIRHLSALDFQTPSGLVLSPLYDIHRERYIVYWNINGFLDSGTACLRSK